MEIYACKTKTEYSAHVYVTLYYVYIYIIWDYDRSSCTNANSISTFLSLSHVRTQGAHEHESDEQRRCVKVQTHRCHLMTQKFAHQLQAAGEVCSLLAISQKQIQCLLYPCSVRFHILNGKWETICHSQICTQNWLQNLFEENLNR